MITLQIAKTLIAAAQQKAQEIGSSSNIAVTGASGNLMAFERVDGAWLVIADVAIENV